MKAKKRKFWTKETAVQQRSLTRGYPEKLVHISLVLRRASVGVLPSHYPIVSNEEEINFRVSFVQGQPFQAVFARRLANILSSSRVNTPQIRKVSEFIWVLIRFPRVYNYFRHNKKLSDKARKPSRWRGVKIRLNNPSKFY